MSDDQLYREACRDIKAASRRLNHESGWRFLSTSRRTLSREPRIAFVTLNPGGSGINPEHGEGECEDCAFLSETWGDYAEPGRAPLQRQVQALFSGLAQRLKTDRDDLMRSTMMSHFIPFRSRSLKDLRHRKESIDFACDLWKRLFDRIRPKLVIAMSKPTFKHLRMILEEVHQEEPTVNELPTGCGNTVARCVRFRDGTRLAGIPHLSRYPMFDRPRAKSKIERILDAMTDGMT